MLDRFPTELITLVVDATSFDAWAFNLQDFSQLLTILSNVKFIHLQRVADSYAINEDVGLCSQPMAAARTDHSWGPGLEQLLTTQRLLNLRELRLSCHRLRAMPADFINQLHAVQVDFPSMGDLEHSLGEVRQIGSSATLSYRPSFALSYRHLPTVPGIAYLHLQEFYICGSYLEDRRIKFFGAGCDDDAFVNSDFLDFIDSRETLS
ncbi:hypothetical protein RHOSPDRAFT_24732 [Rhodotorula sp. JG-1b]|nr:hypothetical protein RHOSPDRAFT_24732 [Rhodotorula sp. JG-1b]